MTLSERFGCVGQASPVQVPGMTRKELADLFCELGYAEGAEIGVMEAEFSVVLLSASPRLHLRCVDSWAWSREGDRGFWNTYFAKNGPKKVHEQHYTKAMVRLQPYMDEGPEPKSKPRVSVWRMLSHEAAGLIQDGSLDFVYIDAEHTFEGCLADLHLWSPKVRAGGVVSGDDYKYRTPRHKQPDFPGVDRAVEQFVQEHGIREWFYTSDVERTIQGKLHTGPGRAFPSFFWQKP